MCPDSVLLAKRFKAGGNGYARRPPRRERPPPHPSEAPRSAAQLHRPRLLRSRPLHRGSRSAPRPDELARGSAASALRLQALVRSPFVPPGLESHPNIAPDQSADNSLRRSTPQTELDSIWCCPDSVDRFPFRACVIFCTAYPEPAGVLISTFLARRLMRALRLVTCFGLLAGISPCMAQVSQPEVTVEPRPASLAGETLGIAFSDRRSDTSIDSPRAAVLAAIRRAFPSAIIQERDAFDEYSAPAGSLNVRITLSNSLQFNPALSKQWRAQTAFNIVAVDRRSAPSILVETTALGTGVRSNIWGNRSGAQALRESYAAAFPILVSELDSVARRVHVNARPIVLSASPEEYATYSQPGTGVLTGQAFLTTRGGDVKKGAGRLVTLDPLTTYSKSWYLRSGRGIETFEVAPPDSLFLRTRKTTTTDAEGRFRFTNVPAGTYLVRTIVTWEAPVLSPRAGLERQGGVVSEVVSIQPGEPQEVILSKTDPAVK